MVLDIEVLSARVEFGVKSNSYVLLHARGSKGGFAHWLPLLAVATAFELRNNVKFQQSWITS